MTPQAMSPRLEARQLRFSVGEPPAVVGVDFRVPRGGALRIEGASGCGKSTLLRVICRLLPAVDGELLLDGKLRRSVPPGQWRQRVAYLAQTPVMLSGTVRDNLAAPFATSRARSQFVEARARNLLQRLRLDQDLLDREASVISGGEASRVALCRALLLQPSVLLADEPTAALDDEGAGALVELVASWVADGGSLLLVAHDAARWSAVATESLGLHADHGPSA